MNHCAMVFPGQGSQSIGMLADLARHYPEVQTCFKTVSEVMGYDLWQLIQEGPQDQLDQTQFTQVAMLTADVAIFQVLQKRINFDIQLMAGHSLGEYAALVCAQAITLPEAALLVRKRGELMQQYVPLGMGAMAAVVGLTDDQVEAICKTVSSPQANVSPANYNALGQVVIAGHTQAVTQALLLAEEQGARLAKLIPVSVPCHCSLLETAATEFASYLERANFVPPKFSVISNVDLSLYETATQIKQLLQAQLYKPVRWVEIIQFMRQQGVSFFIECGPGKVLSGLIKRIDRSAKTQSVSEPIHIEELLHQFASFNLC